MTGDARFEDGAERPLSLVARDAEDLGVISALCQDAVLTAADMRFARKARRFDVLLSRFRWEDRPRAEAERRPFERVRAILGLADAQAVQVQGIVPGSADTVLSLLSLAWEPGPDGTGRVTLTFAGDGAVAVTVEALEASLRDVSRPYAAPSGKAPGHPAA
jgi:hypothetical protein